RHVVTRALGADGPVQPDIVLVAGRARLLLCSDGLWGELTPQTIGRVLAGLPAPVDAARRLLDLVLDGAAPDNASALVVDVGGAVA
uniref:PP2C family protein-serine/threonine phosphatase n=1 Tax=Ilumatobacter sp. TaxID=1967498 RepID=UPI00263284AD